MTLTHIILVRHGRTAWNKEPHFRGRKEIPLDAMGRRQAEATARRIAAQWPVEAVYSSPMGRAQETAAAIALQLGLSVQTDEALLDMDFGEWQGKTAQEVARLWPKELRLWEEAPGQVRIPGGESLDDVRARVHEGLHRWLKAHHGHWIVAVGHAVVNRVMLLDVLGLENDAFWRIAQRNCAINIIADTGKILQVALMNDISHLQRFSRWWR